MKLTIEKRAIDYLQVLRLTMQRLCDRIVREVAIGDKLPDAALQELLFQLHCQNLEMMRYAQLVVAPEEGQGYATLQAAEQCRAECMQRALDGATAAKGAAKALMLARSVSASARVSHPEVVLSKVRVGGQVVML